MQKTGWIKSIKNLLNLLGKAMTNYKLLLRVIKSTGGGTADHALEVFFSCFTFFQFRFPPARWLCLRSECFSFSIVKSSMSISQQGKMHVIWAFGQQQEFYGPDQLKYHGRSNRWEQSYFQEKKYFSLFFSEPFIRNSLIFQGAQPKLSSGVAADLKCLLSR